MAKRLLFVLIVFNIRFSVFNSLAQGWPTSYDGVMLQAFYWDSYRDTQWSKLEDQAGEIAPWFSLIWIPNSGNCATTVNAMGYCPVYWYDHNSCFGSETQLRRMIQTYKQLGTGFMLDAVINHRSGATSWMSFPAEVNPLDGQTYQLGYADVCCTDEVNSDTKAGNEYGMATGANDTGEDFNGSRDLDHISANVQANIIAYLRYCREYLGFTGFRYDMVKGYNGKYNAIYNKAVFGDSQIYSVGEYWDGNVTSVGNWLAATKNGATTPQSAAFDFPLKFSLNACCNYGGYYADNLSASTSALMRSTTYRRYAVTFAENHDTNYEQNKSSDCLRRDTLAANAFILGVSGTPCVFLTHWQAYAPQIKQMIRARRMAGIKNNTTMSVKNAVTGEKGYLSWICGNLYGVVGTLDSFSTPMGYTPIISDPAHHYAYYLKNSTETVWCDQEDQDFESSLSFRLTAVSTDTDARIVYTLDGSQPTATHGTVVASGTTIEVATTTTLKYALLKGDEAGEVQTRSFTYTPVTPFVPYTITIYCKADFTPVYFYAWDTKSILNDWPGNLMTGKTKVINGERWYCQNFTIKAKDYEVNLIINQGSGRPQTSDITGISATRYYTATISNGRVLYTDVTNDMETGISPVQGAASPVSGSALYDLSGRRLQTTPEHGIYIQNGKRTIK